jgi:hypothetical protein
MSDQKQRRKWPVHAEWARQDAMSAAKEAAAALRRARAKLDTVRTAPDRNAPDVSVLIAEAQREQAEAEALCERIQRLLTEARIGRDD